ncbi:MAG: glutamate synthase large subunit [Phycisphaeraceae bacterium]|nr:glutamate synthase large subunit [Phycisphaeraceae bacterium]
MSQTVRLTETKLPERLFDLPRAVAPTDERWSGFPAKRGLYDPANEKDACGVGFIAHIKGKKSHAIVSDALTMLQHMDHRGACGCEPNTGDGAGILSAMPHEFFERVAREEMGVTLPDPGLYGVGHVFLPRDEKAREACKALVERYIEVQDQRFLGWRRVPTCPDEADIGPSARASEPCIEQIFIGARKSTNRTAFCRELYLIRKQAFHAIRALNRLLLEDYHMCSLSSRVIVYKGQLTSGQVPLYYPDLRAEDFVSHIGMVHSRFSTNTFPNWSRAQPMRFMSHNGEINTLRGNVNWMRARQGLMDCKLYEGQFRRLMPIIDPETSDSGMFDNVLELLLLSGRSLAEAAMMMIPEPWENHDSMSVQKRAFYEFSACKQEPWDGPASVAFTDGKTIGACLDRNGLRPSRYYVTHDDRVIMASEVGVLPELPPESVKIKGCLQPGRMFLVDFEQGRIVPDDELKQQVASAHPYGQWLSEQRIELAELEDRSEHAHGFHPRTLLPRMQAFGYTTETMQFMLIPMIHEKRDPVGSMGNDAALACLSDKPRMIYDYFKQLFAQVTNPPIDSIREEVIMSLECYIGPEGNLLTTEPTDAHRLLVPHPILTNEELAAIRHMDHRGWKARTIDITYPIEEARKGRGEALKNAIRRICEQASQAIAEGYSLVVLSDRDISADRLPVSVLLATGAVHHHLVRSAERTKIGIVVETGEAREVHHFCLLVGYGADAINPYLAFESLWQARRDGSLSEELNTDEQIVAGYRKAVAKGMLKVMAKMGISTLASYKGAQIFEAVGLGDEVIDTCFVGTVSRIKGVDFEVLAEEALRRHELGYPPRGQVNPPELQNDGQIHWRADGEAHKVNPASVSALQVASRTNSTEAYEQYAAMINDESRQRLTIRGLLKFRQDDARAIPLEDVEPASEIVKRFVTGAMSFGSISREAHESLAVAMNRLGGKSNTGEGGEDPERFKPLPNGDSKRSAIKQVASGRFGVTIWYLTNADELQIKIVQGAKPGEGGELPGHKVSEEIAGTRHTTPGVGLISPPPHHDIYSIEDLKQLIHDLKNANPSARISVKLVSAVGVGTVAAGVAKGYADHILVSGDTGGTGASPITSIKHAGLPWELGIAETHQTLVLNDLRSRVILQTDGGIRTGKDVAIAAMLGAEEIGFATAPLITLGCIMMRKCHLNTCPVGVATQDPVLRAKFSGKPEYVVNYLFMVAEECRRIMASLGLRRFVDLVGRVDLLETDEAIRVWRKTSGLDLTSLLTPARKPRPDVEVYNTRKQDHGLDKALDNELIRRAQPAIQRREKVRIETPIININRTVGAMLSHELAKAQGDPFTHGLEDDTIHIRFTGSAGQSFGAFLAQGITLELEGDANDYVGKGLSGGKIIIYPSPNATFKPEENILIGNVVLYGAVRGETYFRGRAAERFCVRNSGATAVVEGVGDHGCEYMTGGRVVVLGPVGRNFAAGMSGGIAYIWDPNDEFLARCNLGMVELEKLEQSEDILELRNLIERHANYTGSTVAEQVLRNFERELPRFVKVMPTDYKRVLEHRKARDAEIEELRAHGTAAADL